MELGTPDDSALLARWSFVERDSRGRFYAIGFRGSSVVVYDSTGKYLQSFGRTGQGPGEFGPGISSLRMFADTLYVFGSDARLSVFGPNRRLARTARLPVLPLEPASIIGRDGRIVFRASVRTGEQTRLPYHVVDHRGTLLHSFGADVSTAIPSGRSGDVTRATNTNAGGPFILSGNQEALWTWESASYGLAEWTLAGAHRRTILIEGAPWLARNRPSPEDPRARLRAEVNRRTDSAAAARSGRPVASATPPTPAAGIVPIGVDLQDRIWVRATVPYRDGTRPPGALSSCNGSLRPRQPGWRFCTVIEVIDTRRNVLLATQASELSPVFIPRTDLAVTVAEDSDDVPRFTIWRITLVGS